MSNARNLPAIPTVQTHPDQSARTRTCANPGCSESLTYTNGQPITEQFAIELGMWLTVMGERITPEGHKVDIKTFCSTSCLGQYIAGVTKEYDEAEVRAVNKLIIPGEAS